MFRIVLIGVLAAALAAGGYMLRSQHNKINSLEDELLAAQAQIDRYGIALSDLIAEVEAIQSAYQVREQGRNYADEKSFERLKTLEKAHPEWSDVQLPADVGGMFGGKTGSGGSGSNSSGSPLSGE